MLGGLLSAHLLIKNPDKVFQGLKPDNYNDDLLHLAHDLANRLLLAFGDTKTGLPWPRVSRFLNFNRNLDLLEFMKRRNGNSDVLHAKDRWFDPHFDHVEFFLLKISFNENSWSDSLLYQFTRRSRINCLWTLLETTKQPYIGSGLHVFFYY